jgi:excisionase family DNA binding protein
MFSMENLLTTHSVAQHLGVSPARVRKLIKDGRIAAEKRGRDHLIKEAELERFENYGKRKIGRPPENSCARATVMENGGMYSSQQKIQVGSGYIYQGDAIEVMQQIEQNTIQAIIADPPYYQVLLEEEWDNTWDSSEDYLDWTIEWVRCCKRILRPDGLLYIFGQLGKREHVWLHTCSQLSKEMQFHDMIIWDRAVGYNERYDSFTPQYEMILVLRQESNSKPYFNKDAVRILYDEGKINAYLRDKRYKDKAAREEHLRKGKYATNILRVPSLKGSSKEKVGHPSQKPIALIDQIIAASSRKGDWILDPFLGSGTTGEAAQRSGRKWIGIEKNTDYIKISEQRISRLLDAPELTLD